jgi:hypothetical protein
MNTAQLYLQSTHSTLFKKQARTKIKIFHTKLGSMTQYITSISPYPAHASLQRKSTSSPTMIRQNLKKGQHTTVI